MSLGNHPNTLGGGAFTTVPGGILSSATSLTLSAGGTNQNITISPSGTGVVSSTGIILFPSYTVATLPASAAGNTYGICFVSDATAAAGTSIGTAPTGGGAVKRAVYSTGSAWLLL